MKQETKTNSLAANFIINSQQEIVVTFHFYKHNQNDLDIVMIIIMTVDF